MSNAAPARSASSIEHWDEQADVVVVGYGGAGACATLEARAAGAEVLLLERASGGGGTTALSTGQIYLGGGTAIQKACGFEDSPEEMLKYLLASCGPGIDEAKIRTFCESSVEHFNWLVAQGVPFKESYYGDGSYTPTDDCLSYSGSELCHPYQDIAKPAPRGHTVQQDGIEAGGALMRALVGAVERSGARIETDVLCESLVLDDARRVVGLIMRRDGKQVAVLVPTTVLADGEVNMWCSAWVSDRLDRAKIVTARRIG